MKIFRKFSEIFCPMWGRTNFIWVGQKFSENYCPRTKFFRKFLSQDKKFYPIEQKFSEIFILGQFFSRTKIPVKILLSMTNLKERSTNLKKRSTILNYYKTPLVGLVAIMCTFYAQDSISTDFRAGLLTLGPGLLCSKFCPLCF